MIAEHALSIVPTSTTLPSAFSRFFYWRGKSVDMLDRCISEVIREESLYVYSDIFTEDFEESVFAQTENKVYENVDISNIDEPISPNDLRLSLTSAIPAEDQVVSNPEVIPEQRQDPSNAEKIFPESLKTSNNAKPSNDGQPPEENQETSSSPKPLDAEPSPQEKPKISNPKVTPEHEPKPPVSQNDACLIL